MGEILYVAFSKLEPSKTQPLHMTLEFFFLYTVKKNTKKENKTSPKRFSFQLNQVSKPQTMWWFSLTHVLVRERYSAAFG